MVFLLIHVGDRTCVRVTRTSHSMDAFPLAFKIGEPAYDRRVPFAAYNVCVSNKNNSAPAPSTIRHVIIDFRSTSIVKELHVRASNTARNPGLSRMPTVCLDYCHLELVRFF